MHEFNLRLLGGLVLLLQQSLNNLLLLNQKRAHNPGLNTLAAPGATVGPGDGDGPLLLLAVSGVLEVGDAGEGALAVAALGTRGLLGADNGGEAASGGLGLLDEIGLGGVRVPADLGNARISGHFLKDEGEEETEGRDVTGEG